MQRVYGTTHSFKSGHRSNKKPPLGKKNVVAASLVILSYAQTQPPSA